MKQTLFFSLLQLLYDNGVNSYCDIVDVLKEKYPDAADYGFFDRISEIEVFLDSIKKIGLINYEIIELFDNENPSMRASGFSVIACITVSGFQFVSDKKRDESTIITNNSIRVNTRNQTIILIVAAFLSLCSLIVSYLNYRVATDKTDQKIYLLPSKELINILQKSTTLQRIETYPQKEEKKNF